MGKKQTYRELVDSVQAGIKALSHENATSVEQAVDFEEKLAGMGLAMPYGAEAYDMCPVHTGTVRFKGSCHLCE